MKFRALETNEVDAVYPILLLAEPSDVALRWTLKNMTDQVYGLEVDGEWVGAATVRWQDDPSEVLEFAIVADRQGQGLGKQFLAWLVEEARRQGKSKLLVGTGNTSMGNMTFYQKCGFRMDHVRPDYLLYYRKPRYDNGIRIRDLVVFRYDLDEEKETKAAS